MSVETAQYPTQLNTALPAASDWVSEGDDHIRLVKTVLKTTFPNVSGAVSASHTQLNYLSGVTSGVQAQINTKGDIAGQTWTGTHVFPSTTTIGPLTPTIQGYLQSLTSDVQTQIDSKGAIIGQAWTGAHNFTGATVSVPTVAVGDSSNAAASTAFVAATAFSAALPSQAGNAGRFLTTDGSTASWSGAFSVGPKGAADLNTVTTSGFYGFTSPANGPAGVTDSQLIVSRDGANALQIAVDKSTGAMFTRGATGLGASPVFSPWRRVALHNDLVVAANGGVMDCSLGNRFALTVSGSTALSFSNIPANAAYACVLELNHTAGVITFPAGVVWRGPAPTLEAGKRHLLFFERAQLGASGWYASALDGYSA